MLYALLSDIHGNADALRAVLAHAAERGAERYAILGDLVGNGAEPGEVIDVVAAIEGAVVVRGNDDVAVDDWTNRVLTNSQKKFLGTLPSIVRENRICFVHSSADDPELWRTVDTSGAALRSMEAADATYTFAAHIHQQLLYFHTQSGKTAPFRPTPSSPVPVPSHRRWHAIVGSVGEPRDGNPAAAYTLFDSANEEMTFFRVSYDHLGAAEKIRRAGLPDAAALRVERGM